MNDRNTALFLKARKSRKEEMHFIKNDPTLYYQVASGIFGIFVVMSAIGYAIYAGYIG